MAHGGSSEGTAGAEVFAASLIARVGEARVRLGEAAAAADSSVVAGALDELEDALRVAWESGVAVPRAERSTEGRAGG